MSSIAAVPVPFARLLCDANPFPYAQPVIDRWRRDLNRFHRAVFQGDLPDPPAGAGGGHEHLPEKARRAFRCAINYIPHHDSTVTFLVTFSVTFSVTYLVLVTGSMVRYVEGLRASFRKINSANFRCWYVAALNARRIFGGC